MTKITGWQMGGEAAQTKLLARIMPARGVYAIAGHDVQIISAVAAGLSIMFAVGSVVCGLGLPDTEGVQASLTDLVPAAKKSRR
jgi:hypothetical protein